MPSYAFYAKKTQTPTHGEGTEWVASSAYTKQYELAKSKENPRRVKSNHSKRSKDGTLSQCPFLKRFHPQTPKPKHQCVCASLTGCGETEVPFFL